MEETIMGIIMTHPKFPLPLWLVRMVVGIAAIGILSIFLIYTKYLG